MNYLSAFVLLPSIVFLGLAAAQTPEQGEPVSGG
jgi:hypothetical protein